MAVKAKQIREIVDIETWLNSEWFLGPEVEAIRPYVKKFIIEYCKSKNKRNFLCTGASRTGKSYGVRILLQRILYEMSCWENFPTIFGLSPSTTPKIYWLSYTMSKAESTGLKGLIKMIDKEIDDKYLEMVKTVPVQQVKKDNIKIVFTPLHGTASVHLADLLKEEGYNVVEVKEQMIPDPFFSTVKSPNPEESTAFEYAINLSKEVNAEVQCKVLCIRKQDT